MDIYTIKNLSFNYPDKVIPALKDIHLNIKEGEFVTLCGKSGCGKSTLLKHLKSVLTPHGHQVGEIYFGGKLLGEVGKREQTSQIGYVMQSPDNQIVTDKVWHELAFGLESLGYDSVVIRRRVAEMASFFGIQQWFHKSVTELSGGQKQLLNLAAIMVMQPKVILLDEPTSQLDPIAASDFLETIYKVNRELGTTIIISEHTIMVMQPKVILLDEPTSQLDPIAASDFLETIYKVNRELGTTIIISEHRLEEVLPMSDRVIVLEAGEMIAEGTPKVVGKMLRKMQHDMFLAMPVPMRVFAGVPNMMECPLTVREGREWLNEVAQKMTLQPERIPKDKVGNLDRKVAIELKELWFRYEKDLPDTIKGLSAKVYQGELYALVGGNGTGKSTTLSLIAGIQKGRALCTCGGKWYWKVYDTFVDCRDSKAL